MDYFRRRLIRDNSNNEDLEKKELNEINDELNVLVINFDLGKPKGEKAENKDIEIKKEKKIEEIVQDLVKVKDELNDPSNEKEIEQNASVLQRKKMLEKTVNDTCQSIKYFQTGNEKKDNDDVSLLIKLLSSIDETSLDQETKKELHETLKLIGKNTSPIYESFSAWILEFKKSIKVVIDQIEEIKKKNLAIKGKGDNGQIDEKSEESEYNQIDQNIDKDLKSITQENERQGKKLVGVDGLSFYGKRLLNLFEAGLGNIQKKVGVTAQAFNSTKEYSKKEFNVKSEETIYWTKNKNLKSFFDNLELYHKKLRFKSKKNRLIKQELRKLLDEKIRTLKEVDVFSDMENNDIRNLLLEDSTHIDEKYKEHILSAQLYLQNKILETFINNKDSFQDRGKNGKLSYLYSLFAVYFNEEKEALDKKVKQIEQIDSQIQEKNKFIGSFCKALSSYLRKLRKANNNSLEKSINAFKEKNETLLDKKKLELNNLQNENSRLLEQKEIEIKIKKELKSIQKEKLKLDKKIAQTEKKIEQTEKNKEDLKRKKKNIPDNNTPKPIREKRKKTFIKDKIINLKTEQLKDFITKKTEDTIFDELCKKIAEREPGWGGLMSPNADDISLATALKEIRTKQPTMESAKEKVKEEALYKIYFYLKPDGKKTEKTKDMKLDGIFLDYVDKRENELLAQREELTLKKEQLQAEKQKNILELKEHRLVLKEKKLSKAKEAEENQVIKSKRKSLLGGFFARNKEPEIDSEKTVKDESKVKIVINKFNKTKDSFLKVVEQFKENPLDEVTKNIENIDFEIKACKLIKHHQKNALGKQVKSKTLILFDEGGNVLKEPIEKKQKQPNTPKQVGDHKTNGNDQLTMK